MSNNSDTKDSVQALLNRSHNAELHIQERLMYGSNGKGGITAFKTGDFEQLRWAEKSTDSTIIYVGGADQGVADATASWTIKEFNTTNGTGKTATDAWDDRETASYS